MRGSALILDFGGVVTRTIFETHRDTERALGLADNALTWLGPFDAESDPLWQSMQMNEISERDYYARRAREVGEMIGADWTDISQFIRAARGEDPAAIIRPEAVRAIDRAKRMGCRLAILSNELDLFYGADFRSKLPLLAEFDVIYDATHTGVLKPRPGAYRSCVEALQVSPERCVFVDDQVRNVAGANAFGMRAVHLDVRNPREGFEEALALLQSMKEQADA